MFTAVCAQERARARRKAMFELRAATVMKSSPHIQSDMHTYIPSYKYMYLSLNTANEHISDMYTELCSCFCRLYVQRLARRKPEAVYGSQVTLVD